jgi:hypothetical protein
MKAECFDLRILHPKFLFSVKIGRRNIKQVRITSSSHQKSVTVRVSGDWLQFLCPIQMYSASGAVNYPHDSNSTTLHLRSLSVHIHIHCHAPNDPKAVVGRIQPRDPGPCLPAWGHIGFFIHALLRDSPLLPCSDSVGACFPPLVFSLVLGD